MYYIVDIIREQIIPMKCDDIEKVVEHAKTLNIKYVILEITHLDVSRVILMDGTSFTNSKYKTEVSDMHTQGITLQIFVKSKEPLSTELKKNLLELMLEDLEDMKEHCAQVWGENIEVDVIVPPVPGDPTGWFFKSE